MLPRVPHYVLIDVRATSSGDPEAAQHEIYLSSNSKLFFGGNDHFQAIDDYVESTKNHTLLVNGAPGTGKTRLSFGVSV